MIFFCNFLHHTLKTLVYSGGESVSQHHHGGVDDDFSTPALGSCHFSLASTTIQFQHHFIVMPIKEDLVPFAVVQTVVGQREVVVTIAQIVGNTEEALEDLGLGKKQHQLIKKSMMARFSKHFSFSKNTHFGYKKSLKETLSNRKG